MKQIDLSHPIIRALDAVFIIVAVLMLMNVATFLLVGNSEPDLGYFVEQDNPFARLSWYPLYALTLLMVGIYARFAIKSLVYNPLLYLVLFLSFVSVFVSVAPDVSLRRFFALAMTVLIGIYMGVRPNWKQTLILIGTACAIFCVFQVILIAGFPGIAVHTDVNAGAWKGMFVEKNALGASAALSGLIFLGLLNQDKRRRWIWLTLTFAAFFLVLGSRSTTSLISFVVPAAFLILMTLTKDAPQMRVFAVFVAGALALVPAFLTIFGSDLMFELVGKDATLTGRTDIWNLTWQAVFERPWTGYGYAAFWQRLDGPSYAIWAELEWVVPSAHNSWIEQGLHMGLPGIAMLALLMIGTIGRALWLIARHEIIFPAALLVQLGIFSLSESSVLWSHNVLTCVMFVFVSVLVFRPQRVEHTQERPRPYPRVRRPQLSRFTHS